MKPEENISVLRILYQEFLPGAQKHGRRISSNKAKVLCRIPGLLRITFRENFHVNY